MFNMLVCMIWFVADVSCYLNINCTKFVVLRYFVHVILGLRGREELIQIVDKILSVNCLYADINDNFSIF